MDQTLTQEREVSTTTQSDAYARHVNAQWVKMLNTLQMNADYARCEGVKLYTQDKRTILDFLSGYCVYNMGHNHPRILEAVKQEIDRKGPNMLQSHVPHLAGELAERLCKSAGGKLTHVSFCNSGSEGVDTVVKFARAFTKRPGILYARDGFHGLTCTSLSLMSEAFWTKDFGPMLQDTRAVEFNDLEALEKELRNRQYAVFITEPIQAEAGIRLPEKDYLRKAQELCRKYGTLFALDEVQTGLYRTGTFLSAHQYNVEPDMAVLAKALSGGMIPVAAVLMRKDICEHVFDSVKHAMIHASTFGENSLAMRAGLTALDVLESEKLGQRSLEMGQYLRQQVQEALSGYEMFKQVRGLGMLSGIEFQAPSSLKLKVPFEAFRHLHEGVFGQVLVMKLYNQQNLLAQVCGNNFMVLKAAAPLVVEKEHIDTFVNGLKAVVDDAHTRAGYWSEALAMVARAI